MTSRRQVLTQSAALLGAASSGLILPARAQSAKIRIGLMLPFTGTFAQLGIACDNGFRMALQEKGNKLGGREIEYFKVDDYACKVVNRGIEEKRKICSIGTTTLRALESSVTAQGLLKPTEGWTNLFIHPPHDFSINNSLVTNFHLPKTSLMIMTCAFAGYDLTMEAYHTAIKEKYRFFSYGDALLII